MLTSMNCRLCGSTPAANVAFSGNVGMLFLFRHLTTSGPFCRDCGLRVFRDMTSDTLMLGWWSIVSLVANPFTIIGNLRRRAAVARLATPQRDPAVQASLPAPLDPGKPVLRRFQSWFGPAIVTVLTVGIALAAVIGDYRKQVGGCTDGTEFVSCDAPHDGRITAVVKDKRDCPPDTEGYVQEGRGVASTFYCLVGD
jgi:hypothetical protein